MGAGTLALNAAETYTGATIISAGILQIGIGTAVGSISGTSAITDNATLAYNRSDSPTVQQQHQRHGRIAEIGRRWVDPQSHQLQHLQRHHAGQYRYADAGQHQRPVAEHLRLRLQRHGRTELRHA